MDKPMIIVGPAASGKTRRAKEEAKKRAGNYVVIFWEALQGRFGLGAALAHNPNTIIVEGLPAEATRRTKARAFLKQLASGETLMIEEKYKPRRMASAPVFIFTMLTPPDPDLSDELWRRFEVVEVP